MIVDWKGLQSRALGLALLANIFTTTITLAQSNPGVTFFYPNNGTEVRGRYADNGTAINALDTIVRQAQAQTFKEIAKIHIIGYASIDGDYRENVANARDRALAAKRFVQNRYPELEQAAYLLQWKVEKIYHSYPKQRKVELYIHLQDKIQNKQPLYGMVSVFRDGAALTGIYASQAGVSNLVHIEQPIRRPYARWAIKTNLAQWAGFRENARRTAPVANMTVEYFVTRDHAVEFAAFHGRGHYDGGNNFQHLAGYRLEARKYFNPVITVMRPFAGLYGRMGDYDHRLENNTLNTTGNYWDAGLSAGLAMPIAGPLWIEGGLRAGYQYREIIDYRIVEKQNRNIYMGRKQGVRITEINLSVIFKL